MGRDDVQPAQDRSKVMFERLARVADRIAETAKDGARLNDQLVGRVPGAVHRAACQRRLAVAEEAAAVAYRNLEVPSAAVRRVIVECRRQVRRLDSGPPGRSRAAANQPGAGS